MNGTKINDSVTYSLDIIGEKELELDSVSDYIGELLNLKKVVTFGEEHNLNIDKSFSDILEYEDLIFYIFNKIQYGINFKNVILDIRNRSLDNEKIISFIEFLLLISNNEKSIYNSSSRFFASYIIPSAKSTGFTDIIIEGFDKGNPRRSYELSKDKIGFLMIMLNSMLYGLNIHGAYDSNLFFNAIGIARNFEEQVDIIMDDNSNAKIITYNGGVHNMTSPIKGEYQIFGTTINLEDLSFTPYFIKKYGNDYLSVDLVDGFGNNDNFNHYNFLKGKKVYNKIKLITHSKGQEAIILPTNKIDVGGEVHSLLNL